MDDGPLTITAAADLIRAGSLSPAELLEICLRRIDRYEPRVKAWAYLDRDRARADAEALTAELAAGQNRGPLHGVPVGVKDIIDVFDMPTGCGSKLWANSYARRDATCVARLRQAGAVILGKTVTTAYAYLDPPPTRNPWNLERTPGGSSSGSAAAVACGMCLGALATQTGGSTIRPASYCGVYALKPTHGRVSVDGVLPLAPSLDHVGVMANCVRDLAILYQCIAAWDPRDGNRRPDLGPIPDCVGQLDTGGRSWQYLRCGGPFEDHLGIAARPVYEAALSRIAPSRSEPEWLAMPTRFAEVWTAHRLVMAGEANHVHAERMVRRPDDYPPEIRWLVEDGATVRMVDFHRAVEFSLDLQEELAGVLRGGRVILAPAATDVAPDSSSTGNPMFNSPWSFAGLPVVCIPCGWSADGLPFAVQAVGPPGGEAELLAAAADLAAAFEFPRRLPPVT